MWRELNYFNIVTDKRLFKVFFGRVDLSNMKPSPLTQKISGRNLVDMAI